MPVLACKSCGAPLDLAKATPVVVCRYCKAQNRVASPWPHAPPPRGGRPAAGSAARGVALVLGCMVFVAIVSTISYVVQRGGVLANDASAGLWYALGTCPVDANGDGVHDVAGLNGPIGGGSSLTLVDGVTGELLWRGEEVSQTMMLQCLSERWVAAATDDFVVRLHDARNPDPPLTVRGRDKLQTAVMGDGCVALRAHDGSVMGVALPAGTLVECPVELPPISLPYTRTGFVDESTEVVVGERRVTLAKRQQGTPVLTLGVHEGAKTLFERELPYAARRGAGLAVAGDRIVIYGHLPGKSSQGLIVGFDARTGAELYAVPLEGQTTDQFSAIFYNGRYVVLQYWSHLRAYDPATGKRVW